MTGFSEHAPEVDELSSERMSLRTKPRIREAVRRAAALSGMDELTFTISAAYKAALETIGTHERTFLDPADQAAFFDALENPPEPTNALREAFRTRSSRSGHGSGK